MLIMTFHGFRQPDGTIHIQNSIMGSLGQHHAHTPEDFEVWKQGSGTFPVSDEDILWATVPCDCSLQPGDATNRGWPA